MSLTIKLGRSKAVTVPKPGPQFPYLAKHLDTGEIYLMVGLMPIQAPQRMHGKVMLQNLGGGGPRSDWPDKYDPYYEPVTLQSVKP